MVSAVQTDLCMDTQTSTSRSGDILAYAGTQEPEHLTAAAAAIAAHGSCERRSTCHVNFVKFPQTQNHKTTNRDSYRSATEYKQGLNLFTESKGRLFSQTLLVCSMIIG